MDVGDFLGSYHLNSVTLLINEQSILLAFNDQVMFSVLTIDIILTHLSVQVCLVRHEEAASLCVLGSLLLFLLLLPLHDGKELLALNSSILLHSGIIVSELLLATLM